MADTINVAATFGDWAQISGIATSGFFENGGSGKVFYAQSAAKPAVDFIGHILFPGDEERVDNGLIWVRRIDAGLDNIIVFTED